MRSNGVSRRRGHSQPGHGGGAGRCRVERPHANAVVAAAARDLAARGPWREVRTAFASAARPSLAEAVEELRTAGAQRVAVASYLLAEGFFADRVRTHCTAAGAQIVSAPLGDCPELAAVVLHRYDEALRAAPVSESAAP